MSEECNFLANKIAEPVKRVLFAPVRLVEGVARAAADILTDDHLVDEEHYLTTKLTSPFQVALNETEDELKFHYKILDNGELSDDEWIDGKDRVKLGTSTGNGLRHRYRDIETAEEKRIEAQRKAAEDARRAEEAKQAAEAAKRAETQRKADAQRRSAEQARKDAECCQKTSFGIVAVIAMLWGLAALGKQD